MHHACITIRPNDKYCFNDFNIQLHTKYNAIETQVQATHRKVQYLLKLIVMKTVFQSKYEIRLHPNQGIHARVQRSKSFLKYANKSCTQRVLLMQWLTFFQIFEFLFPDFSVYLMSNKQILLINVKHSAYLYRLNLYFNLSLLSFMQFA